MRNPVPHINDCRHLIIRESRARKAFSFVGEFVAVIVALAGIWIVVCTLASL